MPTNTKKSKSRPPVGRKPKNKKNGGLGGAISRLASNVRLAKKNTRTRKSSNTRRDRIAVGAGVGSRPLRPSRKGLVGIAAGAGLGGVAMAKRRRRAYQHKATNRPPGDASTPAMQDVPAAAHPDDAKVPNGGGGHGAPKGPDLGDAA
jgi:hypothetical protein